MALIAWALVRKSEELKRVSLGVFVIIALLAIPAYLTGEPAEEIVEHLPGVSEASIEEHEDAAKFAFAGVLVLGAAALGGLVIFRRGRPAPTWVAVVALVLSVIVFAMMVRTANLGKGKPTSSAGQYRKGRYELAAVNWVLAPESLP